MKKTGKENSIIKFKKTIPEPPDDLIYQIFNKIELREKRIVFIKLFILGLFILTSLFGILFFSINIISELSYSGFFSFISLLFLNYHSIMANFSDFFYSVIESIPAMSISFLFFTIGFFVWSSKSFMKEFLKNTSKKQIFT